MFAVILGAVRMRTGQAAMVAVLAALAAATAAAAPWYALAVASRTTTADVTAAPPAQRVLTASRSGPVGRDPAGALRDFGAELRGLLPIDGGVPVLGLRAATIHRPATPGVAVSGFATAYRDGFCRHVRLAGACPAAATDAAISRDVSRRLRLDVGDEVAVRATATGPPVAFRVVGLYEPADPDDGYWSSRLFRANGELDPLFTTAAGFADPRLGEATFAYEVEVPAHLLRGDNGYDLNAALDDAVPGIAAAGIRLTNPTGEILDSVRAGRATIWRGVLIALCQLLLLAWFALGLAGRYTLRDRRADAGLLKLRGGNRARILLLTSGQHLIPLVAGTLLGLPAGLAAARLLAGAAPVPAEIWPALGLAAAAAGVALAGGLLVLTVVDAVMLRQPVAALLRRVPSVARTRRADVVDLALVTVAAGAVYQARSDGPDRGLGVVAPSLVALAVALVLARLLGRLANRAGGAAMRGGRLRLGLAAVQVSRQPGTDRVFALLVVTVAMVTLALGTILAGRTARVERSDVELGAARVLTVDADTRTGLLSAVRRADPGGRQAMAVVTDLNSNPPVLAVDSTRLAAVARWRGEYGPVQALPAAVAAARVPAPLPPVTGDRLTLRVRNDRTVPTPLVAVLQHEGTGAVVEVPFGAVRPGERTVSAPVDGCRPPPGCRLVRWQMATPPDATGSPARGALTIRSLTQPGPRPEILGPGQLADAARWRTDVTGLGLEVSATARGLTLAAGGRTDRPVGDRVYAVDSPLPLPVVLAGPRPAEWRFEEPFSARFGPGPTPVRPVGAAAVLPVLGPAGVLVDLDAARRVAADAELGGTYQVWLAPDAPPSILDALRAAGLTVTGEASAADREEQLARQGRVVAARFGVLTAAAGLLLAAAVLAVAAAVERAAYLEQLTALRVQGLPRPVAVAAGYAGIGGLALAGLAGGLAAAVLARPVAGPAAAPFADGWGVVAPPDPLGRAALATAALLGLAALGATAWWSVRPLVRRLRGRVR
ncbi:FtsX-like permease family protein [Jidongwangia harbinensis]|uniref:FtsX-like permease family protein n=1 Tax=Jidongwangia harbinensis TaxID=2878561 RepID=UPI001CD9B9F1|nr:FtsX-like permease family protein [Jidongwangia harbinensis]MCA2214209.1 ABC transporter permease [Jidongwangia harbinensis]